MARVRDLWVTTVKGKTGDGLTVTRKRKTARHPDNGGNKNAKRWLAVWIDPDGNEKTKACATQDSAKKFGKKMEADAERGEYIDPKAGRELFGTLARKHLRLRKTGASSQETYDSIYRNHVGPVFGQRSVKGILPSEIAGWLRGGLSSYSSGVQLAAYLIVAGTLDLAVADKLRRDNPARSKVVPVPSARTGERKVWDRERVWKVIDGHPQEYRPVPVLAAGLGLRRGCLFAVAEEDFDFGAGKVLIRRQVVRIGGQYYFKAPKGGKERTVPVSRGVASAVHAHIAAYPPEPCTLPWMGEDGKVAAEPRTCRLLFRWHGKRTGDRHLTASAYDESVWKPALSRAGIAPPPVKNSHGQLRYPSSGRENGIHVLRHVFSQTLQDAGVPMVGVMEFMGHSRKSQVVTIAVYGHVTEETFEQARRAVDSGLFRLRPVASNGTVTELRSAR